MVVCMSYISMQPSYISLDINGSPLQFVFDQVACHIADTFCSSSMAGAAAAAWVSPASRFARHGCHLQFNGSFASRDLPIVPLTGSQQMGFLASVAETHVGFMNFTAAAEPGEPPRKRRRLNDEPGDVDYAATRASVASTQYDGCAEAYHDQRLIDV